MKSVLISIQPKWCELIASGKKTVEVRKSKPRLETPFKVFIYETKALYKPLWCKHLSIGVGKVIGEFVCDKILDICIEISKPNELPGYPFAYTGLTDKEIMQYFGNRKTGYGWHISNLVIYDKPKELSEFRTLCKYRNNDGSCQYTKVECDCIKFDYNHDYSVNFAECCDFMTRPPQSWCYVEK